MARPKQTTTHSRKQDTAGRNATARPARPTARQHDTVQIDQEVFEELLLQALETERGGIQVYETAISCVKNEDLKEEWEEYLEQTRSHERILMDYFGVKGLDPEEETPGRTVVRRLGETLVKAMQMVKDKEPDGAECVAAECVVLAETKDHMNWQLLSQCAEALDDGDLRTACEEVEDQEDEHLYHTMGWTREIWLQGLGFEPEFPPAEEEQDVKSMVGAGKAAASRKSVGKKAANPGSKKSGKKR